MRTTANTDPFAALEQAFAAERDATLKAFAAEAAELSADEETDDRNAGAASANATPFAAPEQAFVAEVPEEVRDAAAAVVEAVPEPAEECGRVRRAGAGVRGGRPRTNVAQGDEANLVDAAPETTDANGSAAPAALVVPLDVETPLRTRRRLRPPSLPTCGCVRSVRA